MRDDKNIVDLDKPLNWFDRALAIVDKYRFKTIFKAVIVILIVAGVIGFINNPTWIFEQYQIWVDKEHTEAMALREQNDIKIHSITDRLNYRTNSSKTMIMEFHNGVENTGGLPFRKMTCTYEAVNVGAQPIAEEYKDLNLSLVPFVNYMSTQGYWCGDVDEIEDIDRGFCYRLKANGIEHFAACIIEGVDKPLALLIVAYDSTYSLHNCEDVRENIRHCALELALLLELQRR